MKKPSVLQTILSILLRVIVVALIMGCLGIASFQGVTKYLTGSFYDFRKAADEEKDQNDKAEATTQAPVDESSVENILLYVDGRDGMAEYMILSMINTDTNAMDLLFIPENAQVQVSKNLQRALSRRMDGISGSVKFRDIERAYTGEERYEMLNEILEEMMGIKLDGWDHMTADNVVSFLDSVDHVTMNLNDPVSYRDTEGILHQIDEGEVKITGKEAFAYNTYLDGTSAQESNRLTRMNTYFEKFVPRLLSKKKAADIVETYQGTVESSEGRNMDAFTAVLKVAKGTDFLTMRILQGSEVGDVYEIDSQKVQLQIATLMQQAASYSSDNALGNDSDDDSDEISFDEDSGDSKDLAIEIYNAAYVQGLASEWSYYLEDEGYNISLVDTYQDEGPISTTRIILRRDGIGGDLLQYFSGADVSVGEIDTGGDIQIYVGTDHTHVGTSE